MGFRVFFFKFVDIETKLLIFQGMICLQFLQIKEDE